MPLSRVKTLVSMMTPRDFRVAGLSPPFVEFDMSVEGFGCIFLPSIAPQSNSSSSVGVGLTPAVLVHSAMSVDSSSSIMGGGLGTGERVFPPLTGLTFVCWLYIDRFSDLGPDSHPIRLLTITRSIPKNIKGISPSDCPDLCELACLQMQVRFRFVLRLFAQIIKKNNAQNLVIVLGESSRPRVADSYSRN